MQITSGIYFIVNKITGKVYVGSAFNLARRKKEHFNRLKAKTHHNPILQKSFDKYGIENFEFKIVQLIEDLNKILEIEQSWIVQSKCLDRNFGYNLCVEGRNAKGRKHTEETKARMSVSQKGRTHSVETRAKMSKTRTGVPRTVETRLRVGLGHLGIKHPPRSQECKEKLRIINTGKKLSEETKARMRIAQRARWASLRIIEGI